MSTRPLIPSTVATSSDFREPSFVQSVDVEAYVRLLAPDASCKGMFFAGVLSLVTKLAPSADTRTPEKRLRISWAASANGSSVPAKQTNGIRPGLISSTNPNASSYGRKQCLHRPHLSRGAH